MLVSENEKWRDVLVLLIAQQFAQMMALASMPSLFFCITALSTMLIAFFLIIRPKQQRLIPLCGIILCWLCINYLLTLRVLPRYVPDSNPRTEHTTNEVAYQGRVFDQRYSRAGNPILTVDLDHHEGRIELKYFEEPWNGSYCLNKDARIIFTADLQPIATSWSKPSLFSYEGYLWRHGVSATGKLFDLQQCYPAPNVNWQSDLIVRLTKEFSKSEELAIILATVLGIDDLVGREINAVFVRTGTSHLVVISGFHIGLAFGLGFAIVFAVLSAIKRITDIVPAKIPALICAEVFAFLYTYITGWEVSSVRALLAITMYCLAQLIFRRFQPLRTLLLCAVVIGLIWPGAILDIGFELSFMAILGILQAQNLLAHDYKTSLLKTYATWHIQTIFRLSVHAFLVCVFAWLYTLPITIFWFGNIVLTSVIINFVVIPIYTLLVLYPGAIGLFAYTTRLPWGHEAMAVALWLCQQFLTMLEAIAGFSEEAIPTIEIGDTSSRNILAAIGLLGCFMPFVLQICRPIFSHSRPAVRER